MTIHKTTYKLSKKTKIELIDQIDKDISKIEDQILLYKERIQLNKEIREILISHECDMVEY